MSGSMSREWKRTIWQAPQARRTTPRHFLTLPTSAAAHKHERKMDHFFVYRLLTVSRRPIADRASVLRPTALQTSANQITLLE